MRREPTVVDGAAPVALGRRRRAVVVTVTTSYRIEVDADPDTSPEEVREVATRALAAADECDRDRWFDATQHPDEVRVEGAHAVDELAERRAA